MSSDDMAASISSRRRSTSGAQTIQVPVVEIDDEVKGSIRDRLASVRISSPRIGATFESRPEGGEIPADLEKVNLEEAWEVEYWARRFGCTPEQLKAAVRKVGAVAKDVEAELVGR